MKSKDKNKSPFKPAEWEVIENPETFEIFLRNKLTGEETERIALQATLVTRIEEGESS